jgi:NosR/NirI family transcriptional regulator, nitrous oxide reductase regulator
LLAFVLMSVVLGWRVDLNTLEPFDAYVIRVDHDRPPNISPWLYIFEDYIPSVVWLAGWASIAIAFIGLIASLFQPLAYCKYGCPTGALFKLLRFTGDGDKLGMKDWLAAALLVIAMWA